MALRRKKKRKKKKKREMEPPVTTGRWANILMELSAAHTAIKKEAKAAERSRWLRI